MDAVEEVKNRLAIEDVISDYVQLKRAGRNWKGLSPFNSERTPSFVVSPEKGIWHDFSSGRGGDMFSFVMALEGLDFKGALELLARKAGVDLEQYKSAGGRPGGPDKNRLYALLELAAKFYQVQFSQNHTALEYVLKKRRFTKETALEWRLGYSPNTGSALADYAKSKGFSQLELKQAGLIAQRYSGAGDMFRGRLMIPLQDAQGKVIGFTARLLADDSQAPKYINTPQTVLYDKSRHVYGLHLAKDAIRKGGFAVLVEGNLDVIASHQAAVRQAVATAGTALTETQLKTLSRFSGDIRLSFDADRAGAAATERAIPIASKVKVSLSIIDIPSGKDPDELIQQDPELWRRAIDKHRYALDWLMDRYQSQLDVSTAQGKREFSDVLLPIVRGLSDDVERDHYLDLIAKTLDVSKDALGRKLAKTDGPDNKPARRRSVQPTPAQLSKAELEFRKTQDQFLALMLMRPTLREFLDLTTTGMFTTESAATLHGFLTAHKDFYGKPEELVELKGRGRSEKAHDEDGSVQSLLNYVKIQSLLYEELYQGLELNELHYEAARLQARLIEQYVKLKKQSLTRQLDAADENAQRQLLVQVRQLDELLGKTQGAARGEER